MKALSNLLLIIIICACCNHQDSNSPDPSFVANANIKDIPDDLMPIISDNDFCVVFFPRNDIDYNWYKIFSRKGKLWEKIEVRQRIIDIEQLRKDPDYYISRDITTKKLCREEEAKSFLTKLEALKLFELPEEKILFKNCEDSQISDLGYTYILIISGDKVRQLEYSGSYKCSHGEWGGISKIENLFETDWFENSKGR